ncbi:hypothetical protein GCM10010218_11980 [Streptomyces mashuensis]|uniref:Secreted protein n=1 Tax=Streptomyces mashuensis TaxID=33904 RepID=A0A919AZ53_9ACTN|nr:hypothetical protein [Streptomyces mashuensis]GHF32539.1 hypothetical protein GCM10010218_11980 [Streptomyces mashuensis]
MTSRLRTTLVGAAAAAAVVVGAAAPGFAAPAPNPAPNPVIASVDWKKVTHAVSGNFTSPNGGERRDLFVVLTDGSASILKGSAHEDPKAPFSSKVQVAPAGSYWKNAEAVSNTNVQRDGKGLDGLTVRWNTGKLSTYATASEAGFGEERALTYSSSWKNAKSIAVGRHTSNGLRDDLVVVWLDGSISTYIDIWDNGISRETQITKATPDVVGAVVTSGPFTGKDRDDVLLRWKSGLTFIMGSFEANGDFVEGVDLRQHGSSWKYADIMAAGSFGGGPAQDLLVRWADGNLSYYVDVDATGTHSEVQLVG